MAPTEDSFTTLPSYDGTMDHHKTFWRPKRRLVTPMAPLQNTEIPWLVLRNMNFLFPFSWEWKIIPTDFHSIIFQRVGQPPTRSNTSLPVSTKEWDISRCKHGSHLPGMCHCREWKLPDANTVLSNLSRKWRMPQYMAIINSSNQTWHSKIPFIDVIFNCQFRSLISQLVIFDYVFILLIYPSISVYVFP